jgi:hypothetical protein
MHYEVEAYHPNPVEQLFPHVLLLVQLAVQLLGQERQAYTNTVGAGAELFAGGGVELEELLLLVAFGAGVGAGAGAGAV